MQPRGIRNCNPTNIRRSKDNWLGLAFNQTDDTFFQFRDATFGIRAAVIILLGYQDKHHCHTIRDIIDRWAPPNENDTDSYVKAVSLAAGVGEDAPVDVHRYTVMMPLVKAIIWHENGQNPYSQDIIDKGLELAGIHKPDDVNQSTV